MKKQVLSLILFTFLVGNLSVFAQFQQVKAKKKVLLEKAYHYDTLFVFDKALDYYKKFQEKNPQNFYATNRIADINRVLGQYEEAAAWYAKVIELPDATPLQTWYYAQTLRSSGKYDLAKKYYEKYAAQNPNDSRSQPIAESLTDISKFYSDSSRYKIINIETNSPQADFSPAWYQEQKIAFVSSRTESKKTDNRWSGGQSFLDLFYMNFDSVDKKFSEPKLFEGKLISNYHEGPMTFDSSFNKIIFTRNNVIKRTKTSEEGIIKLNLFEANIKDGQWGKVTRLPFNSPDFSTGHPALSKDGKLLIFASDRPDGRGGQDLYYSTFDGNTWSEPVNLGSGINTEGDEVFPFLHADGTLFYASDGMPGLGSLDVYEATALPNNQWGFPKNLGYPINSPHDDFGLILANNKNSGFFSSNRPDGKGDDDIYFFDKQQFILTAYVYDSLTKEPISGALVKIILNADTLKTEKTNKEGYTAFKTPKGPKYVFQAAQDGYKTNYLAFNTNEPNSDTVKIPLLRNGFILEVLVVDKTAQTPIQEAQVFVANDQTKAVDSSLTQLNGKTYHFILANNNFTIKADKFGYFLISPAHISTYAITDDTLRAKLELSYLAAGAIVKLENIYYDFDKFNIRPDAAEELDRLVEIMNKYPKMKIEMRSHTDSRGSDAYNKKLSQNRATSAAKYIISKGIEKNRIAFMGYGETVLVNKCSNNYPCSEAEHQLNRRTEFKVLVQPDGMEVKGTVQ